MIVRVLAPLLVGLAVLLASAEAPLAGVVLGNAPLDVAPRSWALLIGVSDHQDRKLPPLRGVRKDVSDMEVALRRLGFDEILVLRDQLATKGAIERALAGDLRRRVGPDDRVLILFSGNGMTLPLPGGSEEEGYLVPYDGDPDDLPVTAISMTGITEMLQRLPARHTLIILDTCHAGYVLANQKPPEGLDRSSWQRLVASRGVQAIAAGTKGQMARETRDGGLFTQTLIDGLRGGADLNGDGVITLDELGTWVYPRVKRASEGDQDVQWGNMSGAGQFFFPLPGRRNALPEPPLDGSPQRVTAAASAVPAPGSATAPAPVAAAVPDRARPPEPPRVLINYPANGAKVERPKIFLTGLIAGGIATTTLRISVNGTEVATKDFPSAGRGHPLSVPAELIPGENQIDVWVSDGTTHLHEFRTVYLVATPAAERAVPVTARWAVVIGVGDYDQQPQIKSLRYPRRDAEAMYDFLTTRGGIPADHLRLLADATPDTATVPARRESPTLRNLKRALDWLAQKASKDDLIFIYFSGHGAPTIDPAGRETDGLAKYLLPKDADLDSLYSSAFPMDEFQKVFDRILATRVVLLLDTCYSGSVVEGGRTVALSGIKATPDSQFLERLAGARGRTILTASRANEVSLESPDLEHGIFTYYLLQGLRGAADKDGDGVVTTMELYEYLEVQVPRKAAQERGRQTPWMKADGNLPLASVPR